MIKILENKESPEKLSKFLKKLFQNYDSKIWNWEYGDVAVKRGINIVAIDDQDNNKIIGHYGVFFLPFRIGEKRIWAGKGEASFLDAEHIIQNISKENRKNLFSQIVKKSLSCLNAKEPTFSFGFPNQLAIKGQVDAGYNLEKLEYLNYKKVIRMPSITKMNKIFFKDISKFVFGGLIYFLNSILNFKKINKSYEYLTRENLELVESLNEAFCKKYPNILTFDRTKKYIDWRYLNNAINKKNNFLIKSNNNCVGFVSSEVKILKKKKVFQVLDIVALDRKSITNALLAIETLAKKENCDEIEIWSRKSKTQCFHGELNRKLKNFGYFSNLKSIEKNVILYFNSSIEKNLVTEIKNFENWHIVQALQRI